MNLAISTIEIASMLMLVTLAALLTFRLAGFPDLSVDGVFALGGVVFAKLFLLGLPIILCVVLAALAGAFAGFVTASISHRLRINPLLASVLVLILLYSVNLRILGRPNQPLFRLQESLTFSGASQTIFVGAFAVLCVVAAYIFFCTEIGTAMRVSGSSPGFLVAVGKNVVLYRTILVSLAGALVSLSGCFLAIKYRFADVTLGFGILIVGIASLIIGEKLCGRHPFLNQVLAVFCGIVVYELAVSLALALGISPVDVKLATGLITIALLAIGGWKGDSLIATSR